MTSPNPPLQILAIGPTQDSSITIISLLQPNYPPRPLYTIHDYEDKGYEIRNANANFLNTPAVGKIKFHSMSSKLDITLNGGADARSFKMARKDLMGSGHAFVDPYSGQELEWKVDRHFGSGLSLCDSQGVVIARFGRKIGRYRSPSQALGSLMSSGGSSGKEGTGGFEIFVPVQDGRFLDLLVVTGVAAAQYRKTSNLESKSITGKKQSSDGGDALEEIVGEVLGI